MVIYVKSYPHILTKHLVTSLVVFWREGSESELQTNMNLVFPVLLFRNKDLILYQAKLANFHLPL